MRRVRVTILLEGDDDVGLAWAVAELSDTLDLAAPLVPFDFDIHTAHPWLVRLLRRYWPQQDWKWFKGELVTHISRRFSQ